VGFPKNVKAPSDSIPGAQRRAIRNISARVSKSVESPAGFIALTLAQVLKLKKPLYFKTVRSEGIFQC
jgi:hypothetical protein